MLEFLAVVISHNLPTKKVYADEKYAKLSSMQAHGAHLFIEHSPGKRRGGEGCTD